MRKSLVLLAVLAAAFVVWAIPAAAITDGAPDGNGHPYVGLMVAKDARGNPLWRCSGTLLSAKLFLTAGHCTEAPAASAELWFDADVQNLANSGYPNRGEYRGTTYTHPQYDPDAFFVRDLGVVVLAGKGAAASTYGKLPGKDSLDALKPSSDTIFTAVGYGLQKSFPDATSYKDSALKIRMVSQPHLLQINTGFTGDQSILLSNNANTGGTCFGDSGGPNFVGTTNTVGGVTSFGINGTCAGTGGVYRVDRGWNLDWLYGQFGSYLPPR